MTRNRHSCVLRASPPPLPCYYASRPAKRRQRRSGKSLMAAVCWKVVNVLRQMDDQIFPSSWQNRPDSQPAGEGQRGGTPLVAFYCLTIRWCWFSHSGPLSCVPCFLLIDSASSADVITLRLFLGGSPVPAFLSLLTIRLFFGFFSHGVFYLTRGQKSAT